MRPAAGTVQLLPLTGLPEVQEGADVAEDLRKKTMALGTVTSDKIFDHVYTDPHPVTESQKAWLEQYEARYTDADGGAA